MEHLVPGHGQELLFPCGFLAQQTEIITVGTELTSQKDPIQRDVSRCLIPTLALLKYQCMLDG
ncbi:hypothetical protein GDO81_011928 [Engystomops pustulosus]|uniref:Uncharacterized protein n=1 Tax=Engystomops pustulosus TaxID=76066 RepID=A0AAV7BI22_ENGPU|nr:hypothetical protein GDO81_011928 [Engystomops pustulosus]